MRSLPCPECTRTTISLIFFHSLIAFAARPATHHVALDATAKQHSGTPSPGSSQDQQNATKTSGPFLLAERHKDAQNVTRPEEPKIMAETNGGKIMVPDKWHPVEMPEKVWTKIADKSIYKRSNLCNHAQEMKDMKRTTAEALKGAHLKVLLPQPGAHFMYKNEEGKWTGYDYFLLKAVAARAKFEFDIIEMGIDIDGNMEEQRLEMIRSFDLVLDDSSFLSSREWKGINIVFPHLDSSLVLATLKETNEESQAHRKGFQAWLHHAMAIFYPFDKWVWCCWALTAITSGLLYFYLEKERKPDADTAGSSGAEPQDDVAKSDADPADVGNPDASGTIEYPENASDPRYYDYYYDESQPTSPALSVYVYIMHGLTLLNLSPRTWPGRIIVVSWTVASLIFIAGFTANLATILVMEAQGDVYELVDLEDAIRRNARICARAPRGTKYMEDNHRGYEYIVKVTDYPISEMLKGKCDAALVWKSDMELSMIKEEHNPDCRLRQVGAPLTNSWGGWQIFTDYAETCTVLIRDVIHATMMEMREDGRLDELIKDKLLKAETTRKTVCGAAQAVDLSHISLGMDNVIGLFILHFFSVGLAILVYFTCPGKRSPTQCG